MSPDMFMGQSLPLTKPNAMTLNSPNEYMAGQMSNNQ